MSLFFNFLKERKDTFSVIDSFLMLKPGFKGQILSVESFQGVCCYTDDRGRRKQKGHHANEESREEKNLWCPAVLCKNQPLCLTTDQLSSLLVKKKWLTCTQDHLLRDVRSRRQLRFRKVKRGRYKGSSNYAS